jgi:hypothetical protein
MVMTGTIEEKLAQLVRTEEEISGTLYVVYRIPGHPWHLFKYDKALVDSFPMTQEEKDLGIRLCLEARVNKSVWFGSILDPVVVL